MMAAAELKTRHCQAQVQALDEAVIVTYLQALPGWQREGQRIARKFAFANYYKTLAFVNAVAWIAHQQDHHPELTVTYNHCLVRLDTHSVNGGQGGLSENDFICAARIDALLDAAA
ncbi:MAG: pterin-4-alpha-carbinolamine dehydratase protein [Paucimonas sp.]|nr:pterin-4-alpha-carbinolamine dehydratase protein [Paucimonas sp.]